MKARRVILSALMAAAFSMDLQADIICRAVCNAWGRGSCDSSIDIDPTQGCMVWGASCMSVSAPACSGGAGCGFDGSLCGPDNKTYYSVARTLVP
jgi:hypothetical protein